MMKMRLLFTFFVFTFMVPEILAQEDMIYMEAPELVISEWINGDPGTLEDMRGKVIVIDFFQMSSLGCRAFLIPLMNHWEKRYKDRDDIIFLSIHTVFSDQQSQAPALLKEYVRQQGITRPVGVDTCNPNECIPITMRRYKTGGTPCIAIIDKKGSIRFKQLGNFDVDVAEKLLDRLLMN
ncbi:MAG: TlpA family protein disulfide reductase [Candidatus Scalindua sp.]|nr:TlpA family protein disulfide reductase [Candidatus Scalindua sp.]